MKKLTYIFLALATLIFLAVFTACNKEEVINQVKPKVGWQAGTDPESGESIKLGCIYRTLVFDVYGNLVKDEDAPIVCEPCDYGRKSRTLIPISTWCLYKLPIGGTPVQGSWGFNSVKGKFLISSVPFLENEKLKVKLQVLNDNLENYIAKDSKFIFPIQQDIFSGDNKFTSGDYAGKSFTILKGNYELKKSSLNSNNLETDLSIIVN
jgi:hypothetical protein